MNAARASAREHTVHGVPVLRLAFNLEAIRKLAERGLSPDDVADVLRVQPVATMANPNPRAEGSLWAVGPTRAGRFLTVVVEQDPEDHGRWHVRTAWDATPAQIAVFRNAH